MQSRKAWQNPIHLNIIGFPDPDWADAVAWALIMEDWSDSKDLIFQVPNPAVDWDERVMGAYARDLVDDLVVSRT